MDEPLNPKISLDLFQLDPDSFTERIDLVPTVNFSAGGRLEYQIQDVPNINDHPSRVVTKMQQQLLNSRNENRSARSNDGHTGTYNNIHEEYIHNTIEQQSDEEKKKEIYMLNRSLELLDCIESKGRNINDFCDEFIPEAFQNNNYVHLNRNLVIKEINEEEEEEQQVPSNIEEQLILAPSAAMESKEKEMLSVHAPYSEFESLDILMEDEFGEIVDNLVAESEIEIETIKSDKEINKEKVENKEVTKSKQIEEDLELDLDILLALSIENNNDSDKVQAAATKSLSIKKVQNNTYAITELLDESYFEEIRPTMALKFPFELDGFQKQAIMRLERRECVFVAAHTSAGKTVIAEYAIALAQRSRSRCIYTSPIKALSNQKYRDFKEKFGDVGLITGDVSVNAEAGCLIMTTEILRSMLYRGHDTIRDVEWVVFDEVHYVNDAERGVVWEEVIIMLPERINLIFLSATTPNTIEFCDWMGRTKQRKVYISTTNKRPVPLQHYLYHEQEAFRLRLGEASFESGSVAAAKRRIKERVQKKEKNSEALKAQASRQQEKQARFQQGRGGRGSTVGSGTGRSSGRSSSSASRVSKRVDTTGSRQQWLQLLKILKEGGRATNSAGNLPPIDFGRESANYISEAARTEKREMPKYESLPADMRENISKKEWESTHIRGSEEEAEGTGGLLPVIIFSFSKRKCEEIVDFFSSQDLLNAREKGEVGKVMSMVMKRISNHDRKLPQIQRINEMLMRGIGVHHGGLLPLLKEAVELLFGNGVVKVLLATETFAMGVNMPARAVVFDGYRKHDGRTFRDLLPGEYTQMAGRAGRRGKDALGTVLIATWGDVPPELELKKLVTGLSTKLKSKFYLSYNMILNILRVNDLTVEDMIQRSFCEFHTQRRVGGNELRHKLRKCEGALAFTKARVIKRFMEACTVDSIGGDGSDISLLEMYRDTLLRCKELMAFQISHVKSRMRPSDLNSIFNPGRVVLVQGDSIINPTYAVVLELQDSDKDVPLKTDKSSFQQIQAWNQNYTSDTSFGDGMGGIDESSAGALASTRKQKAWLLILDTLTSYDISTDTKNANGQSSSVTIDSGISSSFSKKSNFATTNEAKGKKIPWTPISGVSTSLVSDSHGPAQRHSSGVQYSIASVSLADIVMISSDVLKVSDNLSPSWTVSSMKSNANVKSKFNNQMNLQTPTIENTIHENDKDDKDMKIQKGDEGLVFGDINLLPCLRQLYKIKKLATATSTGMNIVDLPKLLKLSDFEFCRRQLEVQDLWSAVISSPFHQIILQSESSDSCGDILTLWSGVFKDTYMEWRLQRKIDYIQWYVSAANLSHFPDFQQRLAVLRHLGYVEGLVGEEVTTIKGRVACEINTADELLTTEVILSNVLMSLNPPEAAAMLSALVYEERNTETLQLTSRMEVARIAMNNLAEAMNSIQSTFGVISIEERSGKQSLNFGLAGFVYEWARGKSFSDLGELTTSQEGTVVRCMNRLEILCGDVRNAARVMGNASLYRQMEAASQCIKRDIVFAASLYI